MKIEGGFADFQSYLTEVYGVISGVGEEEGVTSDLESEDPWVICPECGEPIYMSDCLHVSKSYWDCPACCFIEEGRDEYDD